MTNLSRFDVFNFAILKAEILNAEIPNADISKTKIFNTAIIIFVSSDSSQRVSGNQPLVCSYRSTWQRNRLKTVFSKESLKVENLSYSIFLFPRFYLLNQKSNYLSWFLDNGQNISSITTCATAKTAIVTTESATFCRNKMLKKLRENLDFDAQACVSVRPPLSFAPGPSLHPYYTLNTKISNFWTFRLFAGVLLM